MLGNVLQTPVQDTFSTDPSRLLRGPIMPSQRSSSIFFEGLPVQEEEMIEAALRDSKGRIFGASGAAVKLSLPRSTLESKIRAVRINKNRSKTVDSSN
jgi:DNA-binding NtrC family response regulator